MLHDTDFKAMLHIEILNARIFFIILISLVNIDFLILSSCLNLWCIAIYEGGDFYQFDLAC